MTCEHEVEFAEKLVEIDQRSKSNAHRLDTMEKNQQALNDMATSVAVMAEQLKAMNQNVDGLTEKVDALESKPGKRWDSAVDKLLGAMVGAFIAWLATGAPGLN